MSIRFLNAFSKPALAAALILGTTALVSAQRGDKAGEEQKPLVPKEKIPPAPILSPEEALRSFKLPPGFQIQLVASEPMIEAPVALNFDPNGRLWVVEMRGFMPTPDGKGETAPVGRVSILEDTDGDGRMDKSTVFLDGLVMPRALMLVRDGVLVSEPPYLWFWRDTNADGRADDKQLVANDYATPADPKLGDKMNPEHASNGLMWDMDNWIYSANHTVRFRNVAGIWQRDATAFRGQWGISQDNFGRIFHNSNSDQLRADLIPAEYLTRNPNYPDARGANVQIGKSQAVWPGRVNPGVNRGYQKGQLREDGTLATFTGACGPVVYRGDNFPSEFRGNAFLCEPTGNLVRRDLLVETNGIINATNAYPKTEFLTSTDERFRPINLFNGPDGALYVVDMYHGIIQHHFFLTSYLRNQAVDRGLDKPGNVGRIYRIVYKPGKLDKHPQLNQATSAELVKTLSHPNGWWRDTAQRLLIERDDLSVLPALKKLAASNKTPIPQLHALWILDGLGQPDWKVLQTALASPEAKVRAAAIRLSESLFNTPAKDAVLNQLLSSVNDSSAEVQWQLACTLGQVKDTQAEHGLAQILQANSGNTYLRDACLSGLGGRELEFLEQLLKSPSWTESSPNTRQTLALLAKCIFTERKPDRVARLLDLAANQTGSITWRSAALLDGILSTVPADNNKSKNPVRIKPVNLAKEPAALQTLDKADKEIQARAHKLNDIIVWPGKPGVVVAEVKPLTPEQETLFKAGKDLYTTTCGACHQPHGNGQEGLAPPLRDSEWALGPEQRLVRIALNGLHGKIHVKGKVYELDMPPLAILDDQQIASVLTYMRREWGHTASPVAPETVAKIRSETEKREEAWTEPELLKIP